MGTLEGAQAVDFGLSLGVRGERDGEWATDVAQGVAQWATLCGSPRSVAAEARR
jgi:hypothetical protein